MRDWRCRASGFGGAGPPAHIALNAQMEKPGSLAHLPVVPSSHGGGGPPHRFEQPYQIENQGPLGKGHSICMEVSSTLNPVLNRQSLSVLFFWQIFNLMRVCSGLHSCCISYCEEERTYRPLLPNPFCCIVCLARVIGVAVWVRNAPAPTYSQQMRGTRQSATLLYQLLPAVQDSHDGRGALALLCDAAASPTDVPELRSLQFHLRVTDLLQHPDFHPDVCVCLPVRVSIVHCGWAGACVDAWVGAFIWFASNVPDRTAVSRGWCFSITHADGCLCAFADSRPTLHTSGPCRPGRIGRAASVGAGRPCDAVAPSAAGGFPRRGRLQHGRQPPQLPLPAAPPAAHDGGEPRRPARLLRRPCAPAIRVVNGRQLFLGSL